MGDPENPPEITPETPTMPTVEPSIPGAPIGIPKPEVIEAPVTNPDIPELQDRRRPRP